MPKISSKIDNARLHSTAPPEASKLEAARQRFLQSWLWRYSGNRNLTALFEPGVRVTVRRLRGRDPSHPMFDLLISVRRVGIPSKPYWEGLFGSELAAQYAAFDYLYRTMPGVFNA